jgi:hypothetical protein
LHPVYACFTPVPRPAARAAPQARRLLAAAHARAAGLLRARLPELRRLAAALLERETLDLDGLTRALGPRPHAMSAALRAFVAARFSRPPPPALSLRLALRARRESGGGLWRRSQKRARLECISVANQL